MNKTYRNLLISAFFILYLFIGLAAVKDYGISWDEPINRRNGGISAVYINNLLGGLVNAKNIKKPATFEIPKLHESSDKYYGVIFELLLVGVFMQFRNFKMVCLRCTSGCVFNVFSVY